MAACGRFSPAPDVSREGRRSRVSGAVIVASGTASAVRTHPLLIGVTTSRVGIAVWNEGVAVVMPPGVATNVWTGDFGGGPAP